MTAEYEPGIWKSDLGETVPRFGWCVVKVMTEVVANLELGYWDHVDQKEPNADDLATCAAAWIRGRMA